MSDFYYRMWRERRSPRNWIERFLSRVGVKFYVQREEFSAFGGPCEQPATFMGIYDDGVEAP